MAYNIEIDQGAKRQLKKIPRQFLQQIGCAIDALAENPRPQGVSKLQGSVDFYRLRVGDYRIIYKIQDQQLIIVVISVSHRREVYRKL